MGKQNFQSDRDAISSTGAVSLNTSPYDYSQRTKLLTMLGVLLVMFLSSLDSTIVSTAMPSIIADLHGFDRYTWASTAYLLTSTVTVPIYGKLSDQLGRKPVFIFGLILFLLGSALSGFSQSMDQLIGFRAFQGIGAGALLSLAIAIVGDLFTPRERGKWQGATGSVFGISAIVGPLVGGWLTQYVSWHWVFYVNLPIGLIALLVLIFVMPPIAASSRRTTIDYLGALLLILGFVPLLLAFSLGGSDFAWLSPQIIAMLAFAVIFLLGFVWYEARLSSRAGEPILDPVLFKNRIFSISTVITMVTNMALYGSVFFVPLYMQGVLGLTATGSGATLTPLMLASVCTSILAGQLVSRSGRYKWAVISGAILALLGQGLLVLLNIHSSSQQVFVAMIVLGLGLGSSMSLYSLIVQNALPTRIGQASAALIFFRSIGGTLALGLMGSVLNATYLPSFSQHIPAAARTVLPANLAPFNNPEVLLSTDALSKAEGLFASQGPQGQDLFNQIITAVKGGLIQGIHNGFMISLILLIVGLVLVFWLPEIPLWGEHARLLKEVSPMNDATSDLSSTRSSFIKQRDGSSQQENRENFNAG
ncbi:DHA2 family efflux MFS transporter permease subunit [Dictyobacter arantiisoli]|uniref:MFS transporter n=1 Tax=Dictyobacter arantiisoli TaxID=2014874 RepID=A0A5A5TBY4_9CHLR|nr:DHA2 family efflux MFS transporter permease subunit [Dictyobacter arantiisoli]GCF08444.1 MFS transporter [Dictyobacter arantiisoli]